MCGLWGIVSKEPRKFDYQTYCTLGINNDSRGGDSCGIFIDGHVEYGAKKENKFFEDFFLNCEFLNNLQESTIAFGHCRKASVGVINESTAQPVVLYNKDNKVDYVLMHNGTISNYKELAAKYIPKIDIKGLTDSQVMALIFYNVGYDPLEEYIGKAVFAIIDYRLPEPEVLLFKGASRQTKYTVIEVDERPLFFTIRDGQLIFSSLCSYMFAIRSNLKVYELNTNCLCRYNGSDLEVIREIDRSKVTQEKSWNTVISNVNNIYDDYYNVCNCNFLEADPNFNIYSIKCTPCQGKIIVSEWGMINTRLEKNSREMYFWNGVLLKNSACFNFLASIFKKSKLSQVEFNERYANVIRFLSIDGIYEEDGLYYKATSPLNSELFTGEFQMVSSASSNCVKDGKISFVTYGKTCRIDFSKLDSLVGLTFKEINEQCKSLTK
jgi:hypothetical protein